MKFIKLFIIVLMFSLLVISCGSGVSKTRPEGWINDDTFRVMGMGSPAKDIDSDDKFRRELTSKQAAELDAKNKIVSRIVGSYIESLSSTEKGMIDEYVIQERVAGRIRGASVVETQWDSQQNCTVVMELYSKGLKKQVDALITKYLNEVGMQYTAQDVAGMVETHN
ncbi:hypothetical protein A966_03076 [Brachyspira hampsonii 30446]|uniref:Lipoprotein n=1 Tax=Brachyspira hampsonii 30446 TaxID=1289135 RepID=A0A2U4FE66_9SPIR|nr:hypothetical protein [Brachyspira hampsonii]EKV57864.1 hypothetical protein A966_03076 [Brachyspira hampsonii 30446]OEJ15119.1 hypothetical protein A9495_01100 [Brachyspira hampsonii]